jgi:hypothetical protein
MNQCNPLLVHCQLAKALVRRLPRNLKKSALEHSPSRPESCKGARRQFHRGSERADTQVKDIESRFWERVNENGPRPESWSLAAVRGITSRCWMWTGNVNDVGPGYGYGTLSKGAKRIMAHRFSYELHGGTLIRGQQIDHLCSRPACVNPEHLEQVTVAENRKRQSQTARRRNGFSDTCAVPGCNRPFAMRGYCELHYGRWLTHGDPLTKHRPGPKPADGCSEEGCDRPHLAKGRCQAHYSKWRYQTDPIHRERVKEQARISSRRRYYEQKETVAA